MKILLATLGLLAIGTTAASAQYGGGRYEGRRYERSSHEDFCRYRRSQVAELTHLYRTGQANHDHRQALIQLKTEYEQRCLGGRRAY